MIKEIQINKDELARLNAELNAKKKMVGTKEDEMKNVDNDIDANFDDMEILEQKIDEKNRRIRELENFLN